MLRTEDGNRIMAALSFLKNYHLESYVFPFSASNEEMLFFILTFCYG